MIFLAGSILLSTFLTLAFKICSRLNINLFQAIVFNYFTCVVTGVVMNGSMPVVKDTMNAPWFYWAMAMGVIFVISFNLIAYTVKYAGLSVAAVASKLSLVIPVLFSVYLYNDKLSFLAILGIGIALVAVFLASVKTGSVNKPGKDSVSVGLLIGLPVAVFILTGLIDTGIKYVEFNFLDKEVEDEYLVTTFLFAFLAGLVFFFISLLMGRLKFNWHAVIAGICIGVPNYFSILCLVGALKYFDNNSSVIIALNNIGIVLLSALAGWLIFREKISFINWVGIALATISIILIGYF